MTTRRLTIEVVIDSRKAKDAMRGLEREVDRFGGTVERKATGAVGGLKTALLALGSAAVLSGIYRLSGSFIDAASEAEQYRVRLKSLLGSVEEGNRLFANMAEFAGRVPFEYREIMSAATTLSGVLKGGVDEVSAWMPLIGDLAAATGLGIDQTTGQVIRMLSAGASAADMFRERGVLAMLGFQAGVTYSLEETRQKLISAWEEPTSKFRGATDDLAQTWAGTMSMLSDAWFNFRTTVMEQGLDDHLREIVGQLVKLATDPAVQQFAVAVGAAMASVVRDLVEVARGLAALKSDIYQWAADGVRAIASFRDEVAKVWLAVLSDINAVGTTLAKFGMNPVLKAFGVAIAAGAQAGTEHIKNLRAEVAIGSLAAIQHFEKLSDEAANSAAAMDSATVSSNGFGAGLDGVAAMSEKAAKALRDRLTNEIDSLRRQVELAREGWADFNATVEDSVWWNRGSVQVTLPEGERLDPWAIPVSIDIPPPSDAELEEFRLNYGAALSESLRGELSAGTAAAVGEAFSTILAGGKVEFERFFQSLGDIGIHFFVDRFATALSKALDGVAGTWKELVATFKTGAGQTAGWLSAAGIVAGAQNTDYAAIGAALGTVVGGILGAGVWSWATAALGASVGAWLGSLVKKGSPEFFGAIESELGKIQIGKSDLGGGAKAVAKAFEDDLQEAMKRILEQIGGTLEGIDPGISLKLKDDKLSVFIDGLEHRFKEDIEGGISFALTEALKRADISGASQTFIQILENTTAKSVEQLTDALDWGRWYERLRLGDVAADLQERMFKFGQDIRRAIEFGLPTDIITLDLGVDFSSYRNQILGIVETDEERIRRQAEAFNQWRQITEAEQLARVAELTAQKATLDAEIAIIRARLAVDQNSLQIRQEMLGVDIAINTAEWELLNSKLAALAAIDAALLAAQGILASLPDLISGQEIQDAINRSRGGGGRQRAEAREDLQAEVLLYGLTDVQLQLAEAGLFADDFAERLRGMGYSAEEAARLLALAQEEEDRRVEQVRADVRQSYYDAIAAAQGLSEIWGIKDQFRDLRQQILDAGFSAEETAERLAGLNWAEGVELQRIGMGIVERLFGYLEGEEAWAEQSLEFARMKVELEFGIMKAQLQLLGIFEQYAAVFDAALAAALAGLELPDIEPPARQVRNHFEDAARDASRIAESFMQAKQSVAEFLNEMLVGTYGGVSPVGGVEEATRQFDEVLRQALTGNIGAIENFDDYGQTLLRLARDAYGSSPEFQAIYDYVLAAGRDVLGVRQGREGNLVFDERFYQGQQNQTAEQQRTNDLLAAIERRLANQQGSRPIAGQGVNR